MDMTELIVLIGGLAAIVFLLWFFFGPRPAARAAPPLDPRK